MGIMGVAWDSPVLAIRVTDQAGTQTTGSVDLLKR